MSCDYTGGCAVFVSVPSGGQRWSLIHRFKGKRNEVFEGAKWVMERERTLLVKF